MRKIAVLGALVAFGLAAGLIATRIPAVSRQLILYEHRHLDLSFSSSPTADLTLYSGGFGWAKDEQFQDPQLGPLLLSDRKLLEHRTEQLRRSFTPVHKLTDDWALMYAASRLQGKSLADILEEKHGLTLALATLAAEADPPSYWTSMGWLQEKLQLQPQGSFRLGLLQPEDVSSLFSKLSECDDKQLTCWVRSVLRHDDGFTPEQREQVLQAWLAAQDKGYNKFRHNNKNSLQRALLARQTLQQKLPSDALGQELSYQLTLPDSLSVRDKKYLNKVWEDFLRACGYSSRPSEHASTLSFELTLEPIVFHETEVDHFKTYTTSEWSLRRVTTDPTRSLTGRGSHLERELKQVEKSQRVRELGSVEILSLVVTARFEEEVVVFALPPFGEVGREAHGRNAHLLGKTGMSRDEFFSWSSYLSHRASEPWRFGLQEFSLK